MARPIWRVPKAKPLIDPAPLRRMLHESAKREQRWPQESDDDPSEETPPDLKAIMPPEAVRECVDTLLSRLQDITTQFAGWSIEHQSPITYSRQEPSMDPFTDLQLLDELIRRAQARLRADINSRAAHSLLSALRGAKTFLLLLRNAEADRAKR